MPRFKKKAQRFKYSLEEAPKNIAPSFRENFTKKQPDGGDDEPRPSTSRARKERKQEDDSLLFNALKEQLQKRLVRKVTDVLGKNENVEALKSTLLTAKRLERRVVPEAEKSHDYPFVQGQSTVHNLPKSASSELSDLATPEFSIPATPSHPKETSASQRNLEPNRTFAAHMNQIIRKDLEPEIKGHFSNVLKNANVDAFDYVCNYDFKVFNTILLLSEFY
ncbi:hypothetical protein G6F53_008156 [Rhizopus delemar]|uniref:Uncharacterized protein n=1 Tax=Rhizopus oryzae TaxID=64495 RepID=A0A9P7C8I1_RHIOR|nr:hypothetical protein G6F53_008156 [Rhizopus delemar]KAG1540277.1 hypothetical protein G6F51_008615 [Rhizopus arrhizus]KAG1625300.1 hypothetical protein G6F44_012694 [Rhizopus delemar]